MASQFDGKTFHIKCGSKYFEAKYNTEHPIITIEGEADFQKNYNPGSFLYVGRCLAEGRPELFRGKTYYGKVNGLGEYIHQSEIGDEVIPEVNPAK
jgi:hypothetical protein